MHEGMMGWFDMMGHWLFGFHNFLFVFFLLIVIFSGFALFFDWRRDRNDEAEFRKLNTRKFNTGKN